jgi:hypothetical protein
VINDAAAGLYESVELFTSTLKKRQEGASVTRELQLTDRTIQSLESMGSSNGRIETYRRRLLLVLTEQKAIIERFNISQPKNWELAAAEERSLEQKARSLDLIRDEGHEGST